VIAGIGLDFGTTNSVLAISRGDGSVTSCRYRVGEEAFDTFRSVLLFEPAERPGAAPEISAGPWAIRNHLAEGGEGRLIQSVKSYLASPNFSEARLFGRGYKLESLIALIVGDMRRRAEVALGPLGTQLVCGRPVQFVGDPAQGGLAESRLRAALAEAGFTQVSFAYEPVGAAYHYCRHLGAPETLLIADFGGGTSDFSLLRVGRDGARILAEPLATCGVGIAGDALDARILREVICPALGEGSLYRGEFDQALPVPVWLYRNLERWHLLSLMNTPKVLRLIDELAAKSEAPRRIAALRRIVAENLGFALNRAVAGAKADLSQAEETEFAFALGEVTIRKKLTRVQFERWITPELAAIAGGIDTVLARAGLEPGAIDRVFMTGGTSLVPAVRQLFETRFGADKLAFGDELLSVAKGLAAMAAQAGGEQPHA
jgi:hypothetical chaperone protein